MIVGVGLLWAFVVLVGPPAHAHTTLVSSSPADGARLDTPPATIQLVFSEPVDARFVTVVVSSADGGHWEDGAPMVSETVVVQPVQRLIDAGAYSIAYRVVAADGHPVTGELSFTMTVPMPTPAVTDSTTAAATRARPRLPTKQMGTLPARPAGRTLRSGSPSPRCCSPVAWRSREPDPEEARRAMAIDREARPPTTAVAGVDAASSLGPAPGTVLVSALLASVGVLMLGLWAGGAIPANAIPALPDPGAATAWALPIAKLLFDISALATVGALVVGVMLAPSAGGELTATGIRCLRAAAVWAAVLGGRLRS